jgi:hypothetical protein
MFRHQNITHHAEAQPPSQLSQCADELLPESSGVKQPRAAVSAGSQKVEMI